MAVCASGIPKLCCLMHVLLQVEAGEKKVSELSKQLASGADGSKELREKLKEKEVGGWGSTSVTVLVCRAAALSSCKSLVRLIMASWIMPSRAWPGQLFCHSGKLLWQHPACSCPTSRSNDVATADGAHRRSGRAAGAS
jgi:hypothetical protein